MQAENAIQGRERRAAGRGLDIQAARPRVCMNGDYYQTLMEASRLTFFDYHYATDILCVSLATPDGGRDWKSVCGFRRALALNRRIAPEMRRPVLRALEKYQCRPMRGELSIYADLQGDGRFRWYLAMLHSLVEPGGRQGRLIGYLRDTQEEKQSELRMKKLMLAHRQLEARARIDAVTGVYNRAALEERVRETLAATSEPCYYFIFDIDDFKAVNDRAGHAEGDSALRMVADVLRRYTRKTDLVGRIGGDEFVALLRGFPSAKAAVCRADCILAAVRELKNPALRRGNQHLSLSAGMAVSSPRLRGYDELYRAADCALYRAKEQGKDRCCIAEE